MPRAPALLLAGAAGASLTAADAGAPPCDGAATGWVLISAALVLFMTIPGLALFYAGLVRAKNALSIIMQCFAITAVVTLVWVLWGYSLAFGPAPASGAGGLFAWIGSGERLWGGGLTPDSRHPNMPTVPEPAFFLFQLTFAIITPALIIGAFAERVRFGAVMVFSILWVTVVYCPIAHLVWGGAGARLFDRGVLDTAGGCAVEIASGVSALVAALMIGRRLGYPQVPMPPHNLALCATGAALLWVGWFGFNAGGALTLQGAVGGTTAMTALNTHLAACTAAMAWSAVEWVRFGKPSVLGFVTGAVSGLVGITPAAMFVGFAGALAIGIACGLASYLAVAVVKQKLRYDDTLDVFGVHGVAGLVGTALTGLFCAWLGGPRESTQLLVQLEAIGITVLIAGIGTAVLLFLIDRAIGLRASAPDEKSGLDVTHHGEAAYQDEGRVA
jgi:Amt family ammonium transporter